MLCSYVQFLIAVRQLFILTAYLCSGEWEYLGLESFSRRQGCCYYQRQCEGGRIGHSLFTSHITVQNQSI